MNGNTCGILDNDTRMHFPTLRAGTGHLNISVGCCTNLRFLCADVVVWLRTAHSWNPARGGVLRGVEFTRRSPLLGAAVG